MARGQATFGIPGSGRGRGRNVNFRGGRGRGRGRGAANANAGPRPERGKDETRMEDRFEEVRIRDEVDEKLGFAKYIEGPKRVGWLVNMHPTLVKDDDHPTGRAGVDYYFIQDDGGMFKATLLHDPYFYIGCKAGTESAVEEWLMKKYEGVILRTNRVKKEDLKLPNHLLGHQRLYLQLQFANVSDLLAVRRELMPLALANAAKLSAVDAYAEVVQAAASHSAHMDIDFDYDGSRPRQAWGAEEDPAAAARSRSADPSALITDIREYDVPYYLRVAIDCDIRVGLWYDVTMDAGQLKLKRLVDRVKRAEPVVMAYDIETTKAPLKFPDQATDCIMMISYMVDGQGFLITNREIVSEDIDDFEYTPKPEYEGPFTVFNEKDEFALLQRWFEHIRECKPTVMATFNGDSFDFPFVEARAKVHGLDLMLETGFARDSEDEFKSRACIHMDCFRWVKRDSYLPQGSQGLKAVTTAKLGYDPTELDPELMTPYASEQPQTLAQYSVSDAVATYYLYMKYVHPFIFSLCNIIPLNGDEVLRKGSGTLCETLLMVEAYQAGIIMPNRHEEPMGNTYEGHLLASETYVGGHVEALEAGVFRSDIATHFKIVPQAIQQLIDDLDAALQFCIVEESKMPLEDVTNYDEIKSKIQTALEDLRDNPLRQDKPLIYHLDVAAMYPNIMLSNRLQPDSVVDEAMCAVCDYNRPGKTCDRRMTWAWRGEYFPAQRDEYNMIRHALNQETFPPRKPGLPDRRFNELTEAERTALLHKRLGDYSRKVYRKTKETKVVYRESIICQRENPFYVDTVRSFRDRRYEYKGLHKTWKRNLDLAAESGSVADVAEAKKMIVLYDSLQLAHKCILNSFYGYVMRKGARWHSMEMAGITCLTGARIIQMARQLVEQIGRPLELDTDGIWCMLPGSFPENFKFQTKKGKPLGFSYPCTMLNHLVHAQFTNHQYHDRVDKNSTKYKVHSENSIFFELDGPYKAMILPSSKEEDKLLKKRYAVFNEDGSLAELKGFEVKRRGELQLIKIFQKSIFERFLLGSTTEECYAAVAEVADQWLDVLFSRATALDDEELVELIAENRSMSKTLAEYGGQKSTSISTAKRLAEFLGSQMVKDKGLACKFIISAKPLGAPVTERAVPVAIFSAEESVKRTFLRKWLKDNSLVDFDLRSILDWGYYIERLGSVIQKLITIPAAMQKVSNPVPRIRHPDWLHKRVAALEDKFQQHKISDYFSRAPKPAETPADPTEVDMEDFGQQNNKDGRKVAVVKKPAKATVVAPPKAPLPDPSKDYSGWLKAMRPRWEERRRARLGIDMDAPVASIFRGARMTSTYVWEIVQIRPRTSPGKFVLWLSLEDKLVSVSLRIPREFYLNLKSNDSKLFDKSYETESVVRTLPRSHPCMNLFRVTVPEVQFLEMESHFAHLTNNPNVDGVYEMQIPHVMRAVLKLGTICTTTKDNDTSLNRARDVGFDLEGLERAGPSITKQTYLNGGQALKTLFIYHATTLGRHVLVLVLPSGKFSVHLVSPGGTKDQLHKMQEQYVALNAKRKALELPTLYEYPDEIDPHFTHHKDEKKLMNSLSLELGHLVEKSYSIVLSSARDAEYFDLRVKNMHKFPVIPMVADRAAHTVSVQLQWQNEIVEKLMTQYLSFGSWLRLAVQQSTYFDVPVGNIGEDAALYFADVDFARRLRQHDVLLWWSPGLRPDLGGMEQDANAPSDDPNSSVDIANPGCYTNVCLAINIRNLALNSVLQSAIVNELEGTSGATAFDSVSHTLNDYTSGEARSSVTLGDSVLSPQIFGILKSMAKNWLLDKVRNPGGPSEQAVDHFWRWLSSPSSQMYDPSMQRFVQGLMKKTFIQMLAEFKRLGSQVVKADFGHIILVTSKPPGTANAYATYLLNAVNSHELFTHLELQPDRFYDFLLFMDSANLGGIVSEDPYASSTASGPCVAMAWNIEFFFPPAVHAAFHQDLRRIIVELYAEHQNHADAERTPLRILDNLTQDASVAPQDAVQQKIHDAITKYIEARLTRRLLGRVSKISAEQKAAFAQRETPAEWLYPLLPGSHRAMGSPVIEYVKAMCTSLSLIRTHSTEIGILRRNLLELVGVREFATEAHWSDPSARCRVPHVVCRSCTHVRDLDLCRDSDLMERAPSRSRVGTTETKWNCSSCGATYDRRAIESTLVDSIRSMVAAHQAQDLKCTKCKQIRVDDMSPHCRAEAQRRIRVLANVATFHGLPFLKEYAESTLARW
ncbi:DNA polymerase epsilon subunit 1 [Ceratobasidium sp. AG-Ba]|nr:DNA polymerase epsilon subunit 1 [Ceratobasidium sp. AG-Ba]